MTSVKTLIAGSDVPATVRSLVSIHRKYYNHPGLVLNKRKLENAYTGLVKGIITNHPDYNMNKTIDIYTDDTTSTLKLKIDGKLFRDWFKTNKYDLSKVQTLKLKYPKHMNKNQILAEILFELSYYKLPDYC